ncbi:MAG: CAP domain-containing protein [Bacteroidia bacterium]|nr:CAP domain-containing protein [Bacteroidia bacterium]
MSFYILITFVQSNSFIQAHVNNTRKLKQGALSLLFVFLTICNFAQHPDDKISIYGFNEKFLEHLIKEKIDSVRLSHQLQTLYNDSILYLAAKHHAQYLYKVEHLDHHEPENPKMENPQKRAEFFGAVNYLVGENIAYTLIGSPVKDKQGKIYTNSTYNQTATDFALMWVHSPGHYKNIITPQYNSTGVAIWADSKTGRIYGVQKFANILFKYVFNENKNFFTYSNYVSQPVVTSFDKVEQHLHKGRHAHKLKNPKKVKDCARCFKDGYQPIGLSHFQYRNDNIYFVCYDMDSLLNLLKYRKDGFAAELVPYLPYDCGNPLYYTQPSRRNKQCVFNGTVLKPIYKKKALKGFGSGGDLKTIKAKLEKHKIKRYELKLGKIPEQFKHGYFETNLVIIQKKKVCTSVRFSGYCGDTLEKFYTLPVYLDSVGKGLVIKEDYKNIYFDIPFQKGKTEYKLSDIKPITDSLLSEKFTADSIIIKAYASVEGKEELNRKIQEERAWHISKALSDNQKEKLNTVVMAQENWDLFERQVRGNEILKDFRGLDHVKSKALLNDTVLQRKLEFYLNLQRVAHIRLRAKEIIDEHNIEKYLLKKTTVLKKRIRKIMSDNSKKNQVPLYLDSLEVLMDVAYTNIKNKHIAPKFFNAFNIGQEKTFNKFNLLRLKYFVQIDSSLSHNAEWVKEFYRDLVNLYNEDEKNFFVNYNMLVCIQNFGKDLNVYISDEQQDGYIGELLAYAHTAKETELSDKLALNFWFKTCRLPYYESTPEKQALHAKCLYNIYQYFKNKALTQSEKNKLGAYYLYHMQVGWLTEILWPDFEQKKNNPEGLVLLAKALYQNYETTGNLKYYEFLKEVYERIGKDKWCPMFVGPCNISFQSLDLESFRNYYCEKCGDYLNYAKAPQNFK